MIGKRIKELRGKETQSQWEARFGVTRDTIRRYEYGKNPPDTAFVEKLCEYYNVNANWLILGDGPKHRGDSSSAANTLPTAGSSTEKLSLGESVDLLAKVYNSGNTALIRAVAANLNAFSEAVDNKEMAQKTIYMMEEMNKRVLAMEKSNEELHKEISNLKNRPRANNQYESTG